MSVSAIKSAAYYEGSSFTQAVSNSGRNAPYLVEALESIHSGISSIPANAIQNETVYTSGPTFFAVYAKANNSYYAGIIMSYYYNPAVYGFYLKNNAFGVKAL